MAKYIRDINEFIILAKTCNYQEAAEMLYISQSSLSKHIQALEDDLGCLLFDRTTRSVSLTKSGEIFLEYAEQILDLNNRCLSDLEEVRNDEDNRLAIGFLPHLEHCGIIEMLSDFSRSHRNITVHMLSGTHPVDWLHNQKCDFIFNTQSMKGDNAIESILYKEDHIVAVLALDHMLAEQSVINISELEGEDFIFHTDEADNRSSVMQLCRKICLDAGFEPHVSMSAGYTSTIVKLVRQGHGVAVMPRSSVPVTIISSVATVDIEPRVDMSIYMHYLKKGPRSAAASLFLDYIRSVLKTCM